MPTPAPTVPLDGRPSPSRRRAALRLLAGAAALAFVEIPALAAGPASPPAASLATTFGAFCDTLVPADELTPAASALGVPRAILASLEGDGLGERLLAAGCDWLDAACAGGFARAAEAERVAACERMQAMPWQSPAGRFFHLMRNTVLGLYYAEPAAWRGLALDRPPQPLGFFAAVR